MKEKFGLDLVIIASGNDLGRLPNTIKHIPNVDNIYILENQKGDNEEITLVHSNGHIHHYLWNYTDEHFHFANARNKAVALSSNEWIIWMDSDDALHPDDCEWINNNLGTFDDTVGGVMFGCSGLAHFEDIPLSELTEIEGINVDNWGYWSSPTIRIIRKSIAKWRGRIHEQVLESIHQANKNLIISDIMVKHRGYCTTLDTYIGKMKRNKTLLEIQLDESTDYQDIYISYLENTSKSLEQLLVLQAKKVNQ